MGERSPLPERAAQAIETIFFYLKTPEVCWFTMQQESGGPSADEEGIDMMIAGRSFIVRASASAIVVALAATGLVAGPVTAQVSAPEDCPEIASTPTEEEVANGITGTGFSVVEGTDPEPFDVEVLGVLANGVAPGRDMIVVETSSPALDKNRGIWFGMSGSPVYDDASGELLGAVAFGLSGGPSKIGGLTPAEDMAAILDYPSSLSSSADPSVALSGALERRVAQREAGSRSDFSMRRLRAPLSVSGMEGRLDILAKAIRKEGNKYVLTSGASSRAAAPGEELATIGAGDTFAAAMSYGDITLGGIGTTTLVCDDQAIAFGHPFSFSGKTELGANRGLTHTIVDDPLFGPYKLADITEPVGTVDQDRLAGIRAALDVSPELRPVTSSVTAPDINQSGDGSSQAVTDDVVPLLGFYQLVGNIDSTFDALGEGTSRVAWTFTGQTESGEPWSLSRSNVYSSSFDISVDSSIEVMNQLSRLLNNRFTEIDFETVDLDATVEEERRGYRIRNVLHKTGGGAFTGGRRIRVQPGSTLALRVKLGTIGGGPEREVNLRLDVPGNFRSGFLEVKGGGASEGFFACFEEFGPCSSNGVGKVKSFDELIDSLEDAPKGSDLTATLTTNTGKQRMASASLDGVVSGSRFMSLRSTNR